MLIAQASLAGNFNAGWAIVGGLVGGVGFLMVVYMGLAVGMTRMNFLYILGSMMTPRAGRGAAATVGFVVHMMLSAAFGLLHAGLLHAIGVSSVAQATGWDVVIGAVHGAVILVAMPMMLTAMHPLVRSGAIESQASPWPATGR